MSFVVGYNFGQVGVEQLPDAGDVQEGVDRGDGTTGTFSVPTAANVKVDQQYGAAGTEFTGTLVPNGTVIDVSDIGWID